MFAGGLAAAATAAETSLIHIEFADPAIPTIHLVGEPHGGSAAYGVSEAPAVKRARERVARETPPPDPALFELRWVEVAVDRTTDYDRSVDFGRSALDTETWEWWAAPRFGEERERVEIELRAVPVYDTGEYFARLADWQRARVRAYAAEETAPRRPRP